MDKLFEVFDTDLDAIEIGAAILGTGGGGNPYIGKLRCRLQLQQGRRIKVIPIDELRDDALVVSLGRYRSTCGWSRKDRTRRRMSEGCACS